MAYKRLSELREEVRPPLELRPQTRIPESGGRITPNRSLFADGPITLPKYEASRAEKPLKFLQQKVGEPVSKGLNVLSAVTAGPIRSAMEAVTKAQQERKGVGKQLLSGAGGFLSGPLKGAKSALKGEDKYSFSGITRDLPEIIGGKGTAFEKDFKSPAIQSELGLLSLPLEVFLDLDIPAGDIAKAPKKIRKLLKGISKIEDIEDVARTVSKTTKLGDITKATQKAGDITSLARRAEKIQDIVNISKGKNITQDALTAAGREEQSLFKVIDDLAGTPAKPVAETADFVQTAKSKSLKTPKFLKRSIDDIPEMNVSSWKDKIFQERETLERNIERVTGGDAEGLKDYVTEPRKANEANKQIWIGEMKDYLDETKKIIKLDSKDDLLTTRFGEAKMTLEELKEASPNNWQNIQKTAGEIRGVMDETIDAINKERIALGLPLIPKRKNYMRNARLQTTLFEKMGMFLEKGKDVPTHKLDFTELFGANKPFSTTEIARHGDDFEGSAIRVTENYIDAVADTLFHTDTVQRVRNVEEQMRKAQKIALESGEPLNLPNFYKNLRNYGNNLAGKATKLDEGIEEIITPTGLKFIDFITKKISANMVGGNFTSAISNFIPFQDFIPTTKNRYVLEGLQEGLRLPFTKNFTEIGKETSSYLTRMFPRGKSVKTIGNNITDASKWFSDTVNRFTARSVVSGKYFEGLSEGLDSKAAMKAADDYAGRLITDKSKGGLPNMFSNRILRPLMQFQSEVNNSASFRLHDIPRSSKSAGETASIYAQIALLGFAGNEISEKVTGRRPMADPIDYFLTATGIRDGDIKTGERLKGVGKDTLGQVPFTGGLFGGKYPVETAFRSPIDFLSYVIPPTGGGQIRKTLTAAAVEDGDVKDSLGRTKFTIPEDEKLKTLFSGIWSASTAQDYLNRGKKNEEGSSGRPAPRSRSSRSRPSKRSRPAPR